MTDQWRGMILDHYRDNVHLTNDADIKACHIIAADYHMLLAKVDEMKNFRLLDTGHTPFLSDEDRMNQSGARVGLSLPEKGSVEGGGLEDKYMKSHQDKLDAVLAQTGRSVKGKGRGGGAGGGEAGGGGAAAATGGGEGGGGGGKGAE
jgi:uncharacterized membrane protein YgcG